MNAAAISTGTKVALPLGVILSALALVAGIWLRDAAIPRLERNEAAAAAHGAALGDHGDRLIRLEEREKEQRVQLEKMDRKLDEILRDVRARHWPPGP